VNNGYKILDSDAHIVEPIDLWQRYIDPAFRDRAPKILEPMSLIDVNGTLMPDSFPRDPETLERHRKAREIREERQGGDRYAEPRQQQWSAPSHLAAFDREGVDMAVLYPTLGLHAHSVNHLDPKLSAAICRAYNDWLTDFCSANPKRLLGAALLPVHGADEAVAEAERVATKLGMRVVALRPNPVNGHNLNDPYYNDLYGAIERLGLALAIHEGAGTILPSVGRDRFYGNMTLAHVVCHPAEQMIACASLVLGGVLQRFPGLLVAHLESGASWMPYWLYRMDEHLENFGADVSFLAAKPSEYFKRQGYISCDADEGLMRYTVEAMGDDNLLYSTDYPHPDGKYPEAVQTFLQLPGLSKQSRRKVLWDNGIRFYRLGDSLAKDERPGKERVPGKR